MEKRNLSIEEFSKKMKITKNEMEAYLLEEQLPEWSMVENMAVVLRTDISEISEYKRQEQLKSGIREEKIDYIGPIVAFFMYMCVACFAIATSQSIFQKSILIICVVLFLANTIPLLTELKPIKKQSARK